VKDGGLGFAVQHEAGGIGFRVAADDHDPLPQFGHTGNGILTGGGFADTAFAVECNLSHGSVLLMKT
jgi:hypothetical protein